LNSHGGIVHLTDESLDLKAAHAEAKIALRELVATMVFKGDPIDGEVLEI